MKRSFSFFQTILLLFPSGMACAAFSTAFSALQHHNLQSLSRSWTRTTHLLSSLENYDNFQAVSFSTSIPTHKEVTLPSLSNPAAYNLPPLVPGEDFQIRLEKNRRIVAFGDVHGDIIALKKFLEVAKVLDMTSPDNPKWIGRDTILVQCGDILDRGDDELACFRLLASLSRQARSQGGQVHVLFGNHESLNSVGLFQYATVGGSLEIESTLGLWIDSYHNNTKWRLQYAGNNPSRWKAFEPGGLLSKGLLARMHVAMVIGRTVFVHAGLTSNHLKTYGGIPEMNRAAREWALTSHHGPNNDKGDFRTVEQVLTSAQFRATSASKNLPECLGGGIGSPSPVWMRDFSSPADKIPSNPHAQTMINECLEMIGSGVQRMVMGHTPQRRINSALDGKAWRVDVGASRGVMAGTPEVLEIIHGGDDEEDTIHILTVNGRRVPAEDRSVWEEIL